MSLLSCFLEAHSEEHNHHRFYHLEVTKNLFDSWTVETRYGRVASYGPKAQGQKKLYMVDNKSDVIKLVIKILKKRLSAKKRIGTPYLFKHIALNEKWPLKDLSELLES